MNKDNAKDYLPLVRALAEGKTIEAYDQEDGEWYRASTPTFSLPARDYRIKPEPKKFWVVWDGGRMAKSSESPIPPYEREAYEDAGWVIEEYARPE